MTRRRLLFGLLATVVAVAAAAWILWPVRTAITQENAAKIEKGMTLTDVETILGGPARDESAGAVIADLEEFDDFRLFGNPHHAWQSDRVLILVWMGADGRVENRAAMALRRDSALETLRRWFRF